MLWTRQQLGGVALIALGSLGLAAPLWPRLWASWQQQHLAAQAKRLPSPALSPGGAAPSPVAAPTTPPPAAGSVLARLSIPALALNAVVLAGDSDAVLARAPGWVPTTALPGQAGTAVIAAHNATFFRYLDRLKPGDVILVATQQGQFRFRVQDAQVVKAGTPILNTIQPTLALEACYPLNALYLTPWRYVVTATLTQSRLVANASPVVAAQTAPTYSASIPPAVTRRFGLSLSQNALPMGTLTYLGNAPQDVSWEESAQPYQLIDQALRLWFAANHLSATSDVIDWRAISLPGTPLPPYWGHLPRTGGPADVAVTLDAAGHPTSVSLHIGDVSWPGHAPTSIQVVIPIRGEVLRLGSIRLAPQG
ncbi:MAG: class D sortase [Firmicutes bacterium]|nr:class D sortase [Bacillota bacterium]